MPAFELDRQHALIAPDLGAEVFGDRQLRIDAPFGPDEAGARLVVRGLVAVQVELGKAGGHLGRIKALVGNAVVVRAGDRRGEEIVAMVACGAPARRLDDEPAALGEEVLAGFGLELTPDRVGTPDERRVVHPLPDRLTRDSGVAVRRAVHMRRRVAVDAQRRRTEPRELVQGGCAGRAEADDDDVRRAHRAQPTTLRL